LRLAQHAGFTRVTDTEINKEDRSEVYDVNIFHHLMARPDLILTRSTPFLGENSQEHTVPGKMFLRAHLLGEYSQENVPRSSCSRLLFWLLFWRPIPVLALENGKRWGMAGAGEWWAGEGKANSGSCLNMDSVTDLSS
jgi:hypothetical protein